MTTTVFQRVGHYEIEREIGRGGMALVFLASDTRTNRRVALKIVPLGHDREAREILEAEQWGTRLQEQFWRSCRQVPEVYECGELSGYFYIAMEYVDGRNLSDLIAAGPFEPARAAGVAIELCRFVEAAHAFEATIDGRRLRSLLHGDLKPRNVRVTPAGQIKVLDFGIAKALSLSRKVTRNDFGSIAYLSPERLESGDMDAHADFWAVGVLLYEMLTGTQPFCAPDTRRLEQRIRSRRPPPPLDPSCPIGLQAIAARFLAPRQDDRYASAAAILDDLTRLDTGQPTSAEALGWPGRAMDEPPTRRTVPAGRDEEATRRTEGGPRDSDRDGRTSEREDESAGGPREGPEGSAACAKAPASLAPRALGEEDERTRGRGDAKTNAGTPAVPVGDRGAALQAGATAGAHPPAQASLPRSFRLWSKRKTGIRPAAPPPPARTRRQWLKRALLVAALMLVVNEISVGRSAGRLSAMVPARELAGMAEIWTEYDAIERRSYLRFGIVSLERALRARTLELADRVIADYRTGLTTVWEAQWAEARATLVRARVLAPGSARIASALRYCEGHLHRINGEARLARRQTAAARQAFNDAVTAFREAAEMRTDWPDPFLGLMRTFIYGLDDIDRAADALRQAEQRGYTRGDRETAQLADGYRSRGANLWRTARRLTGLAQEQEYLRRAAESFRQAIDLYGRVPGFADAAANLRNAQRALAQIESRLTMLAESGAETAPRIP